MQRRKLGKSDLEVDRGVTLADLGEIAAVLEQVKIQGERYPAALEARVGR